MTLKELSQVYYLSFEIQDDMRRVKSLRESLVNLSSPSFDSARRQGAAGDRTERILDEIAGLEQLILEKQEKCIRQERILREYIRGFPDSQIRLIFQLRFLQKMTWLQVARRIGGPNTEDSVKKMCYRALADRNRTEQNK